jgi:hypothetical protein
LKNEKEQDSDEDTSSQVVNKSGQKKQTDKQKGAKQA